MTADNGSALTIGVGSPVVDMVARVSEMFSSRGGGTKGGMQHADNPRTRISDAIVASAGSCPEPRPRAVAGRIIKRWFMTSRHHLEESV